MLRTDIVNGIESIEFAPINPDGSLGVWTRLEDIEAGSVSLTSNADTETPIIPEDKDSAIVVLYTAGNPDVFNFALLQLSVENFQRFFNVIVELATTEVTVLAKKKRANLAIRFTSIAQEGLKKRFTYKNTTSVATYKNNITKNGLLSFGLAASILPWKHTSGQDALYTVQTLNEDGTPVDSTPTPTTFDTVLQFDTDPSPSAAGVTATMSATNATAQFEFNAINPHPGTAANMVLQKAGADYVSVDYTTDYSGKAWKFTDTDGTVHTGTFASGNQSLS